MRFTRKCVTFLKMGSSRDDIVIRKKKKKQKMQKMQSYFRC